LTFLAYEIAHAIAEHVRAGDWGPVPKLQKQLTKALEGESQDDGVNSGSDEPTASEDATGPQ